LKTNYSKQKKAAFAYFKVNTSDARPLAEKHFTLYDFINNSFSFSATKKDMAIRVLQALKEKPRPFAVLQADLGLKKSTLYLLLVALSKSGLVEFDGRGEVIRLSNGFSSVLNAYAEWWRFWSEADENNWH
jgi:DNA-binding transcriptional ArsR family regulator